MITNLIFFILASAVLIASGSWIVKYLTRIASYFKLSGFVAAFILMAFSTSLPELFLGISSAINKDGGLALGTIIGSNIANLSLVIGIAILLARGIKVPSRTIRTDAVYVFGIVLLMAVLAALGAGLSRFDGFILLLVFVLYVYKLFKSRKKFSKETLHTNGGTKDIVFSFSVFFIGVFFMLVSSHFVVEYGSLLAIDFALPPIVIGLFLIGFGSSLPELVFQVKTALSGRGGMSLGDALGSVVANSSMIVGLSALIHPIQMDFSHFVLSAVFMVVITFVFVLMIHRGENLTTKEGLVLIMLYVLFLMSEFYINSVFSRGAQL